LGFGEPTASVESTQDINPKEGSRSRIKPS
jgi:hypothetical protein